MTRHTSLVYILASTIIDRSNHAFWWTRTESVSYTTNSTDHQWNLSSSDQKKIMLRILTLSLSLFVRVNVQQLINWRKTIDHSFIGDDWNLLSMIIDTWLFHFFLLRRGDRFSSELFEQLVIDKCVIVNHIFETYFFVDFEHGKYLERFIRRENID